MPNASLTGAVIFVVGLVASVAAIAFLAVGVRLIWMALFS